MSIFAKVVVTVVLVLVLINVRVNPDTSGKGVVAPQLVHVAVKTEYVPLLTSALVDLVLKSINLEQNAKLDVINPV